jgi:predicted DNA-binding transcriptional regulator AlpA
MIAGIKPSRKAAHWNGSILSAILNSQIFSARACFGNGLFQRKEINHSYLLSSMEIEKRLDNIEAMLKMILFGKELNEAPGEVIGIEEAAVLCQLSKKTLYNYINMGKMNIPSVKRGQTLLFKKRDVIRWNAERTLTVNRVTT